MKQGRGRGSRPQFPDKLDALASQFSDECTQPGEIPARPRKTLYDAHTEWLSNRGHHNRNCFRGILCGAGGRRTACDDQVHTKPHQFVRQCWKTSCITVG